MSPRLVLLLCWLLGLFPTFARGESACRVALLSLSDPAKLATLGERGANPRLKKIVYWLDEARRTGEDPEQLLGSVLQMNRYRAGHARLVKVNLLRNLKIGDQLGFFSPENRALLRRGNAPVVRRGPYVGDKAHVDHIIPVSIAPEIGNDLANLELMPATLNLRKSARIGLRQTTFAQQLFEAGVLEAATLGRIQVLGGSASW